MNWWLVPSIMVNCFMWSLILMPYMVQFAGGITNLLDFMITLVTITSIILGCLVSCVIVLKVIIYHQDKKDTKEWLSKQQKVKSVE